MYYTIDRITDGVAQLEPHNSNKEWLQVEESNLPKGAYEGAVIQYINNRFIIDYELTQSLQERVHNKLDRLRSK